MAVPRRTPRHGSRARAAQCRAARARSSESRASGSGSGACGFSIGVRVAGVAHHSRSVGQAGNLFCALTDISRTSRFLSSNRHMTTTSPSHDTATERRLTELEIKASYADDLLDTLNQLVARQQEQIELL